MYSLIYTPGTRLTSILHNKPEQWSSKVPGTHVYRCSISKYITCKLFLMVKFLEAVFFVCCCCFFMFPTCHVCINLRNSPRGVPRTPNRLMHDAYVRKFDAFLKVIYFGKSFGLWMFPKIMVFPPKSSINRVFHYFHHPFWGTTVVGNIHIGDEILPSYMRSLLQPLKINQDFTVYPPCSLKRSQRSYP